MSGECRSRKDKRQTAVHSYKQICCIDPVMLGKGRKMLGIALEIIFF